MVYIWNLDHVVSIEKPVYSYSIGVYYKVEFKTVIMVLLKIILSFMVLIALTKGENIVELATRLGATTLVDYVRTAELDKTLETNGPFTIFAPSNDAFAALPQSVKDALSKDTSLLTKVLLFHGADGITLSKALSDNMLVPSLDPAGLQIRVNVYRNVFAGSTIITTDGAKVVLPDQMASNGVIHVIDRVMFPLPVGDIVKTVIASPNMSTLVYAVVQGQLAGALSAPGPFTLFAPNNAAFDKLPVGALSDLLSNQTALVAVLKYHVVSGTVYSAGLTTGPVATLEGRNITVHVAANGIKINNAKVLTSDIPSTNGVVHEIDHVLLPPN